ncbi:hypothetical protein GJAV_G00203810 [Gymnothorax javanicus]|nr:hypothetical protein GJAV_G00203810 [Gymnothorax javanicus]
MGSPLSSMDQKENLIDKDLNLTVVLPGGVEKMTTVPGSKPMMDLLVMLCAKYHLNPANHTMELVSPNRNHIKFKPNALIGTLEADKILLKPKGVEDKSKKTGPQMPEATVRLIINYKRTQKTILRVSPRVPIEELMPAICEKCEFDPKTSVLLRDVWSEEPLDLTKSLNDFGLREVYAKDTNALNSPVSPLSLTREGDRSPSFKSRSFKEKENKGFFGMFRRSRKKSEQSATVSAPTSPVLSRARPASMPLLGASASVYNSNATLSDVPKKRRAPLPPTTVPHSPTSSVGEDRPHSPTESLPDGDGAVSGLRRGSTKRRAPPPPSSTLAVIRPDEAPEDQSIKVGSAPHSPLEEISELEEMAVSSAPETSVTNVPMADGSPDTLNDAPGDSGKIEPPPPPIEEDDLPPPPPPPPQFLDDFDGDEGNDLSSDGKPADEEASSKECTEQRPVDPETPDLEQSDSAGPDLSPPVEVEPSLSSEATVTALGDEMKSDSGACEVPAPSSPEIPPLPQPSTQDASSLTTKEETRDAPEDRAVKVEAVTVDGPTSPAEVLSPPPPDVQPPSSPPPSSPGEAARPKRDMATSTEELPPSQQPPASPQPPNSQPIYLLDYAPKPKPSNEVTRDYIPKVGLTTYTIVPQKSLRFYEVELTLEAPGSVPGQIVALGPQQCLAGVPAEQLGLHSPTLRVGPPLSNGRVAGGDGGHVNAIPARPAPATAKTVPPPLRNVGTGLAPAAGVQPKKTPPPTKPKPGSFRLSMQKRTPGYVTSAAVKSANASHASRPAEVPGRVEAGQPANGPERESFPPPPPPVVWTEQEETKTQGQRVDGPQPGLHAPAARLASRPADHTSHGAVSASRPANTTLNVTHPTSSPAHPAPNVTAPTPRPVSLPANATLPAPRPAYLAPTVTVPAQRPANSTSNVGVPPASTSSSGPRLTRQYSLPARDPSSAMTLERLRGLMVPKPYAPASQSRFARAVTTAMRRSHSFNRGSTAEPQPPRVLPPSPLADQPSIKELAEPSRTVDQEAWGGVEGKTVAPWQEEEPEWRDPRCPPWTAHPPGERVIFPQCLKPCLKMEGQQKYRPADWKC